MPANHAQPTLILASSSRYRRQLLERLRLPFQVLSPAVDETPHTGETPSELAVRLALAKAGRIADEHPRAVVIGSDQVLELQGQALGKPGTHERALAQLQRLSGQDTLFHTAVAVVRREPRFQQQDIALIRVRFRKLQLAEIERYLRADQPYDCAGSARSESLGITLLERIDSDDPTALIGLPLIRTARMLRAAGLQLP